MENNSDNFSDSFITDQFMLFTELYNKNKITVKNAWKLQIIDMLKPLCKKQGQDVLQVASTSIDISTKVYCIRVDDLHSKTLTLANNMGRLSEDAAPAGDESADEQGGLHSEKAKKKKKKKVNIGVKTTIAKNSKSNLKKLRKLEPTNFMTRVNADTIDNLFSNSLKESSSSFILLDASKKFFETSDSIVKNDERIPLNNVSLPRKNYSLCDPLHDFEVGQWDPQEEKNLLNPDKSVLSEIQPVVFDDNGVPIPELDFSDHDCSENNVTDVDEIRNDKHEVTCRSTPRFSGQPLQEKQKKQKKKKQQKKKNEMIDFFGDPIIVDFTNTIEIKKGPSIAIDKITLPPLMDQSCVTIMQNIKELILKPGVCPVEKTDKPVTDTEEPEVNCSQSQPNDNDNVDDVIHVDDVIQPLVNPEMVPNTYVHYAQTSKQVDMKKLKKVIWTKLTDGKSEDQQKAKVNPQNFSDMFQSLPDLLGKNEKQKVSRPLAFVALLHLANEQNLELKQLPGYKDCQIMGPTDINSD